MKYLLQLRALFICSLFLITFQAKAIIIDESIDGDFSDLPGSPSSFILDPGDNFFSGTTIAGDPDIISVTIDIEMVALQLVSYTSPDNLGFMGMQLGSLWTEGIGGAINPANLLGWAHFGPGNGTVGTDILDNLAAGPGAMGFSTPLAPGQYTFLIQQTGGAPIDYQFNFITAIDEPHTIALFATMLLLLSLRRRI